MCICQVLPNAKKRCTCHDIADVYVSDFTKYKEATPLSNVRYCACHYFTDVHKVDIRYPLHHAAGDPSACSIGVGLTTDVTRLLLAVEAHT